MAPLKSRFDPTAYAEKQRQRIEHAKQLRGSRSTLFSSVDASAKGRLGSHTGSETGSVSGGSLANSRSTSPSRASYTRNASKSVTNLKRSSSLSAIAVEEGRPPSAKTTDSLPATRSSSSPNQRKNNNQTKDSATSRPRPNQSRPPSNSPLGRVPSHSPQQKLDTTIEDPPVDYVHEVQSPPPKSSSSRSKHQNEPTPASSSSTTKKAGIFKTIRASIRLIKRAMPSMKGHPDDTSKSSAARPPSRPASENLDASFSKSEALMLVASSGPKAQQIESKSEQVSPLYRSDSKLKERRQNSEKLKTFSGEIPSFRAIDHSDTKPFFGARKNLHTNDKKAEKINDVKYNKTKSERPSNEKLKSIGGKTREIKSLETYLENSQLSKCPDCQRKFRPESLSKHSAVCKKVFGTRRKTYDSSAIRRRALQQDNVK